MRELAGAPKVAMKQDNSLEISFGFADGSSETIACPSQFVAELLQTVATFDKARPEPLSEPLVELLKVSYEAGAGRVAIGVPADQRTINMVIGHEQAVGLGERLLHAAKKSTEPVPPGTSE